MYDREWLHVRSVMADGREGIGGGGGLFGSVCVLLLYL